MEKEFTKGEGSPVFSPRDVELTINKFSYLVIFPVNFLVKRIESSGQVHVYTNHLLNP